MFVMGLQVPGSITASKVNSFKECGLAFRLSVIEKIPQPPTVWTIRGTLTHLALERFYFNYEPQNRTRELAVEIVDQVWNELDEKHELGRLLFCEDPICQPKVLLNETKQLVLADFDAEDPTSIIAIGTELRLETKLGDTILRGVIDRLDLNSDGSLTVTDYKTGRLPDRAQENERLAGVMFYALLCEKVLGVRPKSVQLVYLREATCIVTEPTDSMMKGLENRTEAIWRAVCNACAKEDFRPRPSKICKFCAYQELCPAQGGSLDHLDEFRELHGVQPKRSC